MNALDRKPAMTVAYRNRTHVEISPVEPVGTITRTLNATREIVWRAVSAPEHLVQWWGPRGCTNTVTACDFRDGGRWQIRTDIPNGPTVVSQGEFREIAAPEKIVRTSGMERGMNEGFERLDELLSRLSTGV